MLKKTNYIKWTKMAGLLLVIFQLSVFVNACSESEDEEDNEYANWEERNDVYLNDIVAQCQANSGGNWKRVKSCYKDAESEGNASEYVYVQVMKTGDGIGNPLATDSVRVSYQGRLIPSKTYPEGYVFDGTVYGSYNAQTNATAKFLTSAVIEGWTTALLQMHRGDYWRLYIPYQMGYGTSGSSSIPGYSVLIFDVTLVDFSPIGEAMPVWSARVTL